MFNYRVGVCGGKGGGRGTVQSFAAFAPLSDDLPRTILVTNRRECSLDPSELKVEQTLCGSTLSSNQAFALKVQGLPFSIPQLVMTSCVSFSVCMRECFVRQSCDLPAHALSLCGEEEKENQQEQQLTSTATRRVT